MSAVHFLRPDMLWLLLALVPLAWWLWRRGRPASPWRDTVDPHLLAVLLEDGARQPRARGWVALPLLALAIVALAGPSWSRQAQPAWESSAPLVVAMDLSGAMRAADLEPSRLARSRAKLDMLLRERRGGEVGLLVFDQDAYVVSPLTGDAANVALFVDALTPDIMPLALEAREPSHAAPAIGRATDLLQQAGFSHGDILVISDHAGDAARDAAARAAIAGYRVSTLGVGTAQGGAWRDSRGAIHQAQLDAGSLRALARAGKGRHAGMTADASDLASLGLLEPRDTLSAGGGEGGTLAWRDQGYWLLLPLLLLVPFGFRRGSALTVLLLCALLPWRPAQASGNDWWQRPDQQAYARMERGAEAYRAGRFDDAAEAWRGLPGADATYNLGNALAKQGRYEEAVAAYDEALRRQPGMEDAIANRAAVLAAMQRRQREGGGQGGGQDGDQGDKQGRKGERQQGDKGSPGQPPPGNADEDAPGQADPADAADGAAQDAADAAQRERMRKALQGGREGRSEEGEPRSGEAETTAEREQRLANEAWLRRVPDDPGGLLRERFRIERLRREREQP